MELELAFVFGIHSLFIFSAIVLIIIEHYEQKDRYQLLPIAHTVVTKTFDAMEFKASTEISVFDLEQMSIRRVKKRLALQLLQNIEEKITFTHYPPIDKPYERIDASILIGVQRE